MVKVLSKEVLHVKLNVGINISKLVSDVVKKKPIKPSKYVWVNATQSVKVPASKKNK